MGHRGICYVATFSSTPSCCRRHGNQREQPEPGCGSAVNKPPSWPPVSNLNWSAEYVSQSSRSSSSRPNECTTSATSHVVGQLQHRGTVPSEPLRRQRPQIHASMLRPNNLPNRNTRQTRMPTAVSSLLPDREPAPSTSRRRSRTACPPTVQL